MTVLATVPSNTTPGVEYEIRESNGRRYCTCQGWKYKKECSHLREYERRVGLHHRRFEKGGKSKKGAASTEGEGSSKTPKGAKDGKARPVGNRFATKHGYDPFLLRSAIQKAIRRGDVERAYLYSFEMCVSGKALFANVFNCLNCVLHEDIGISDLTAATYASVNLPVLKSMYERNQVWDLALANIIRVMCGVKKKSHVAVTLASMGWNELEQCHKRGGGCGRLPKIPDYAYDMHTSAGKGMGRGWEHFIEEGFVLKPESEEDPYGDFYNGWAFGWEHVTSRPYNGMFDEDGLEEPNRPTDVDRAKKANKKVSQGEPDEKEQRRRLFE